jgi:hypothetical protein
MTVLTGPTTVAWVSMRDNVPDFEVVYAVMVPLGVLKASNFRNCLMKRFKN